MKHPQHILAVEAQPFVKQLGLRNGFNVVGETEFLEATRLHMVIALRDILDNRPTKLEDVVDQINYLADLHGINFEFINPPPLVSYKGDRTKLQLLPYLIFRRRTEQGSYLYSVYQRGKGVGESRLAGNDSCGYGGHIDFVDTITKGMLMHVASDAGAVIDPISEEDESTFAASETVLIGARRELAQEVQVVDTLGNNSDIERNVDDFLDSAQLTFGGLIWDKGDDVGHLHLGIVYFIDLPENYEARPREEQLLPRPMMTAEELAVNDGAERWTRIVAQTALEAARGI